MKEERSIPLPFYGRLVLNNDNRFVVQNCMSGLKNEKHANQINIEIEIAKATIRPELNKLKDKIVFCAPNEDETDWIVKEYK